MFLFYFVYPRLDAVAADAELEDKSTEDLERLADILHNSCVKAVAEYDEKLKEDPNFDGKLPCIALVTVKFTLVQGCTNNNKLLSGNLKEKTLSVNII